MFNIEMVPARLKPFDWVSPTSTTPMNDQGASPITNDAISGFQQPVSDNTTSSSENADVYATVAAAGFYPTLSPSGQFDVSTGLNGLAVAGTSIYDASHPLYPLTLTDGLVFPYNPMISENVGTKYDVVELTHTNENIHAFRNVDNVRITLSECVWTAETFDRAVYTLGVIHFFRSYRLMDFGRGTESPSGKRGTGRPPSPMWFSAYGDYMYHFVPVLIERVDFSFPADVDYIGVPNPGTDAYNNQQLQFSTGVGTEFPIGTQSDGYTWIPMKFTIGSIGMIVQHSVAYWTREFNLDDFKAGRMINPGRQE